MAKIKITEISLGNNRRTVVNEKSLPRFIGRRGVYAAKDLKKGDIITEENIVLAKPWKGISVEYIDDVLGKKARFFLKRHKSINWGDIE